MKNTAQILLITIFFFLTNCAHQGMPPGGPVDKQPPQILVDNLVPPSGSTRVAADIQVEILFNETVDRQSVEDAFFMSPYPKGGVEFKWKSKKLILKFPQGLEEDRTYVVTIGTDTKDLRQNKMKSSFTLAFATGDSIDQGIVRGFLKNTGSVSGTQIWAYSLIKNENPNPQSIEADYITQCDEDGNYTMPYLAIQPYRLFAVADKDFNRIYEPEYDLIGVCTKDALLDTTTTMISECNFQLTRQDTTKPGLYKIYTPDNRHIGIRFDESIASTNTDKFENVLIQQLANNRPVDTLKIYEMYHDTKNPSRMELITETPLQDTTYRVVVKNLYDLSQNSIAEDYSSIDFTGNATPDTIRPQLVTVSPADSSINVALDKKFEFLFSESMNDSTLYKHFNAIDTSANEIPVQVFYKTPNLYFVEPSNSWPALMQCKVQLQADSILDKFGNSLADSMIVLTFKTLNRDTLSSIQGILTDQHPNDVGPIFLTATQARKDGLSYEIKITKPGEYLFENILPGDYLISGFRDRDGNGEYSYGQIIPYVPAERFFSYPDTINVRSRWPSNEGNDIIFKK